MVNDLDVISVRIEEERGVIAGVIGAKAGLAVIAPACREPRVIGPFNGGSIWSLKSEMGAAGELAKSGGTVDRRDDELVCPEKPRSFPADRNTEYVEERAVETLALFEVPHDELEMIDESAPVEFIRFHGSEVNAQSSKGRESEAKARRLGLLEIEGRLRALDGTLRLLYIPLRSSVSRGGY